MRGRSCSSCGGYWEGTPATAPEPTHSCSRLQSSMVAREQHPTSLSLSPKILLSPPASTANQSNSLTHSPTTFPVPHSLGHSPCFPRPSQQHPPPAARPRHRHGCEQQHHGVHQLPGPPLHDPHRGDGGVAGVAARRRGLRAAGAVARGGPGRAAPAGRACRLRRRLLEPPGAAGLLPLRHGRARHAPPRAPRARLRRRARVRRVPGARQGLRRLPPGWVLVVAEGLRRRRPRAVGGHPGVRGGVRHLREARRGELFLHRARPVLHDAPLAHPVRMLQASDGVRVLVREPDGVDGPGEPGGGRGLRGVEQRPGVLGEMRNEWRKANAALLVATVALIFLYVVGCSAFRNAQTEDLFRRYKWGNNY